VGHLEMYLMAKSKEAKLGEPSSKSTKGKSKILNSSKKKYPS